MTMAKVKKDIVKITRQNRRVTIQHKAKKKKGRSPKGAYVHMRITGGGVHHVSMTASESRKVAYLLLLYVERLPSN
jgi:hypothetical protein